MAPSSPDFRASYASKLPLLSIEPSLYSSRLRTSTTLTRSSHSSISLSVLAPMFCCVTTPLPVLWLSLQQGPCHPQHRPYGHHQVDGHLVALQHHERDDRDHQREDVEPGQRDAVGNNTCVAKYTARLAITPTTAAVTPMRIALSLRSLAKSSM